MSLTVRLSMATSIALVALMLAAMTMFAPPAKAQTDQAVVAEAESYLGVPFVYGGESYAGVDCSGLVTAVYGSLGVSLPHDVYSQASYGTPVASPAPGDLVFGNYGYGNNSHVGIATGDGYMINAPYPGSVVRYDPIGAGGIVNGYTSIF